MAEKIITEIEVKADTTEVVTLKESLDEIEDSLRDLKKVDAAEASAAAFAELNKIVDENVLAIQELGTAADNYKNIAIAAGKETPIGQAALKKAAELERQMDQTNQAVTKLNDSGRLLSASLDIGTGVIAGYSALTGAQALLGEENEDLLKSVEKLQAAQSLLMGLQELRNTLDAQGTVVTTAKAAAEKASTAATNLQAIATNKAARAAAAKAAKDKALAAGTKALTVVQKAFNAVIKANPMALLVLALTAVVAGIIKFRDSIKGALMPVLNTVKGAMNAVGDAVNWVGRQLDILPSKAEQAAAAQEKAAQEARDAVITIERAKREAIEKEEERKTAARLDSFDFEIRKLQAAGKETLEVEKNKLRYVLERIEQEKKLLQEKADYERKLAKEAEERARRTGSVLAKIQAEGAKVQANLADAQSEALTKKAEKTQQDITIIEIKEQKKRDDEAKKAADAAAKRAADARKKKEAADKAAEADRKKKEAEQKKRDDEAAKKAAEQAALEEANRQAALKEEEELAELLYQATLTQQERELTAVNDHYFELIERAKQYGLDTTALEEEQATKLAEINDKYRKEQADKQQKADDKRTKAAEERAKALEAIEQGVFNATSSLIEITAANEEEAAERKKKLAVVQLAIDTAKAISGAVAQAQSVPFPGNLLAIVTGVTTVLANIAKAKQLLSQAGATGGGGGATGPAPATDIASGIIQDNVGGETTTNTDDLLNGTNNSSPQIVLPIETMTSGQERLVQLEQQSTI